MGLVLGAPPAFAEGNPLASSERLARRLAVQILKELKPAEALIVDGTVDPAGEAEVREIVARQWDGVSKLERLESEAAEDAQTEGPGDPAVTASLEKIRKYQRIVSERYGRLTGLVGVPTASTAGLPGWRRSLRGTMRAGFGVNSAKSEVVGGGTTETDVTRSEFAVDLISEPTPADEVTILLARSEEIRFAPATRSRAAAGYARKLAPSARVGARVGYEGYRNESDETSDVNRTELAVFGSAKAAERLRGTARFSYSKGSFPNASAADYSDTRIILGASGDISAVVDGGLTFTHTSHQMDDDAATEDNTQDLFEGRFGWKMAGGSQLSVTAHALSASFDDSSRVGSYTRRGVKLMSRRRGEAGSTNTAWFEYRGKQFDEGESRNYTDLRAGFSRRGFGTAWELHNSSVTATYRNYKAEGIAAYLDYIEFRYDSNREAHRGAFWESSTYGQYFFKSDSTERNAQINVYSWFGLALGEETQLKLGPHMAANTELVTVDGAVDGEGNEIGFLESPNNTVRYGVKAAVRMKTSSVKFRASGRYEILNAYNIEGASSPKRLELEGDGTYRINERIDASLTLQYFSNGSNETGDVKSSEVDLLLGATYHLGGR